MTEESMMILELLRDGKVSASEAERLLRTVRESGESPKPPPAKPASAAATLGQAAQSAAKLAGKALDFIPKPKMDPGHAGDKVSGVAADALRAAKSAARDVAAEVSKLSDQAKKALRYDAPTGLKRDTGRPTGNPGQVEVSETIHSEVNWEHVDHLLLVNLFGNISVRGEEGSFENATITLNKTAWGDSDGAGRLVLQQAFSVTRIENGVCRLEVIAPNDAAEHVTVDYEIAVPNAFAVEARTTFGNIETTGLSPAQTIRAQSGRLSIKRPAQAGAGEARLTTTTGDILVDGWNTPGAALRVETQSGDVEVQESHCGRDLIFCSRSGDISLTDGSSGTRVSIENLSGAARLNRLHAPAVDIETTNGNILVRDSSGALTLKTAGGSVEATGLQTPAVSLNTVSGSAHLTFSAPFSGSIAGTTVSGDMKIGLWDNSDSRVDLATTSGSIECSLALIDPTQDGNRRLTGKLGDGTGSIRLQSVSGDLQIEKDAPAKKKPRSKNSG